MLVVNSSSVSMERNALVKAKRIKATVLSQLSCSEVTCNISLVRFSRHAAMGARVSAFHIKRCDISSAPLARLAWTEGGW